MFSPNPLSGQAFAASGQAFIGQFHSPCVAPCFLLQLVPSLRYPTYFTPEFFSGVTVYCFSPQDTLLVTVLT